MRKSTVAAVAAAFVAMGGCQKADTTEPAPDAKSSSEEVKPAAELQVEVFYRERMMLPPTATVTAVLEDGAKMDVAAERIAEETVSAKSGPPYRMTLAYDPSSLSPKGRFGVRARIENQGKLMFVSTEFIPAFGVDGSYDAPPSDPVPVLVRRMPDSIRAAATSITGTRWVLQTLRGEPAGVGAGGQAPHITLQGAEPRVSGFAGCNQISGGYTLESNQLTFGQTAMTMRACPEGEELERNFAKVLGDTKRYEVDGDVLKLMDGKGAVIAELRGE
ncbi:MAG: META domain-containing protein [Polyangiales bacterium]